MFQFHSWPSWKCKNNKNLHMLGLWRIPSTIKLMTLGKSIQSRGVFSTSTGTKGHLFFAPNKHQRWWGLSFSNQQDCWSSKLMYVWNLETYFPGVIKFGHLKMHGLRSLNTTSFRGFHHSSGWKETPWGLTCFQCFILSTPHQSGRYKTVKCGWRLETKSPTSKSLLKGNKSTQLVGGHTILIHPVDQHLVKAYRNFQNIWSFQALQCQGAITQLKTSLNGRLVSRMWGFIPI